MAAPPRIARMVIDAARRGAGALGGEVATLLVERGLGGNGVDLADKLDSWRRDRGPRSEAARKLAANFTRQARAALGDDAERTGDALSVGQVLALAFPERIAKARGRSGEFLLANGRAASVEEAAPLAKSPFLAVGEVTGRAAAARIVLAASLTFAEAVSAAGAAVVTRDEVSFEPARASLSARRVTRIGAIVLNEQPLPAPSDEAAAGILARGLGKLGLDRLPWGKALAQWRDRVAFLRGAEGDLWPDLSDERLSATIEDWLAPYLTGKASLAEVGADDLSRALHALLPYDLSRRLEIEAPTHWEAPTGSRLAVDYGADTGPAIAVRVQELFGVSHHPSLAGGRVPLTLNLLSPGQRPIQITRDLPGFWRGSWAAVKAEMRGRYPRHPWPDDPAAASATTRAKPRGS